MQFTPDLLPGDITGVTVYDQRSGRFEFHPGPVFANIVLADEINRASPKTQSALLEVMEEGQVTVDGQTHPVGHPFMVIATQNPVEQAGTYRLPEAQLDRFLMRIVDRVPRPRLDHPHPRGRRPARARPPRRGRSSTPSEIVEMAALARTVYVDPTIHDYVSRLVDATRTAREVRLGVSVRGALALIRAAKTHAAGRGRHYVVPDDVKALAEPVLAHRLILDPEAEFDGVTTSNMIAQVLIETPPPSTQAGRVTFAQTRTTHPRGGQEGGRCSRSSSGEPCVGALARRDGDGRVGAAVQGVVTPRRLGGRSPARSSRSSSATRWGWLEFIAIGWGLVVLVAVASRLADRPGRLDDRAARSRRRGSSSASRPRLD